MKFFRSKFFIICVIVAAVLVLVPALMSALGYTDVVRIVLKTAAKPFEWCSVKAADAVSGFVSAFTDYDDLKKENEELRASLKDTDDLEHDNQVLKEENEWLKSYLKIKKDFPNLVLTDATIIARESGNYATVLTLNRGRIHGLAKGRAVITADGLFGHVSEIGLDWCKVVSIVETASAVRAVTDRTAVEGTVEGDYLLRADAMCKMIHIKSTADVKVGDKVYTAGGEGSIYPPNLLIGTVTAIEADENSRELIAYIRPAVEFDSISSSNRVMVITGYDDGGSRK